MVNSKKKKMEEKKKTNMYTKITLLNEKIKHIGKQQVDEFQTELQSHPTSTKNEQETDWTFTILYVICLFLFAILIIFIQAFFVKILWNYFFFCLFGAKTDKTPPYLTWLSSANLLVLVRILFF